MFKFKESREKANLTQKEAALSLDVSVQSISNWENEVRRPSLEQLLKIADLYNVTTDELLGRTPIPVTIKKEAAPQQPPEGMKRVQLSMDLTKDDPLTPALEKRISELIKAELEKKGL